MTETKRLTCTWGSGIGHANSRVCGKPAVGVSRSKDDHFNRTPGKPICEEHAQKTAFGKVEFFDGRRRP